MSKCLNRKIHKGCPFTEEELLTFYDMLYNVNTGNHCSNPAPIIWAVGSQMAEQFRMDTGLSSETLLREENEVLRKQLAELKVRAKIE